MVPLAEIADPKNDYNLNIPRYLDSSAPEDVQDLHAHLHGGIPNRDVDALSGFWDAFPLFARRCSSNRPGYGDLAIPVGEVQQAILDAPEFVDFAAEVAGSVDWLNSHRPELTAIDADTQPNRLIATLSDNLLARFKATPLLDEYDVYEQLMSYWHSVMHDDVFLLMTDGWLPSVSTAQDDQRQGPRNHRNAGSRRRVGQSRGQVQDGSPPAELDRGPVFRG